MQGYAVYLPSKEGFWFVGIWKDKESAEIAANKQPKGQIVKMAQVCENCDHLKSDHEPLYQHGNLGRRGSAVCMHPECRCEEFV